MNPYQALNHHLPFRPAFSHSARSAAYLIAQAAQLAYPQPNTAVFEGWGEEVHRVSRSDADVTFLRSRSLTLVSCRGSEFRLRDWLRNLAAWPKKFLGQDVHAGFLSGTLKTARIVEELVGQSIRDGHTVVFTGHSQGAANAMLHAAAYASYRNVFLVTFGCPAVGDWKFAEWMNQMFGSRHIRFMHANDIVPRIPWVFRCRWLPLLPTWRRVWHCGNGVLIRESGEWLINRPAKELRAARRADYCFDLIRDHSMQSGYVNSLRYDAWRNVE